MRKEAYFSCSFWPLWRICCYNIPPMARNAENHIPALDGLRGVAVLLVFIFHSIGPLITSILLRARDAENYYRVFYARRALRILPLYYLALTVSLLTTHDHYPFRAQIWFWLNISNLVTAFTPTLIPWVSHYWSLAVEEQFYLIWPAVVRRASPPAVFNLCIFVIASLLVVRNFPAVQALSLHWDNLLYRLTPFRVDTLCGGALLAVTIYRWPDIAKQRTLLRVTCLISAVSFIWFTQHGLLPRYGYTAVVLCFTSLVDLTLYPGVWARFLSLAPLTATGRYSYCIYLIHPLLIMHANHFIPQRLPVGRWHTPSVIVLACVEFLIAFGVAALSYQYIESPILSLKRHTKYRRPSVKVY
jgi:peptidoglycan/LPS O-acetylase OafA/YrhL